jgi:hypothetical protein
VKGLSALSADALQEIERNREEAESQNGANK